MNNIFYTKTQNFKLFGKVIFSKETVYNEIEHETEYDIIVSPGYFKEEFEIKKENKQNGKDK